MCGQLHASAPLSLGKEIMIPTLQEAGWVPSQSGRCGLEKSLLSVSEIEPGRQAHNPLLYHPSYRDNSNNYIALFWYNNFSKSETTVKYTCLWITYLTCIQHLLKWVDTEIWVKFCPWLLYFQRAFSFFDIWDMLKDLQLDADRKKGLWFLILLWTRPPILWLRRLKLMSNSGQRITTYDCNDKPDSYGARRGMKCRRSQSGEDGDEESVNCLAEQHLEKFLLRRWRWENNTKTSLKIKRCEDGKWMKVAKDLTQWRAFIL
jgi:hypothetical protein